MKKMLELCFIKTNYHLLAMEIGFIKTKHHIEYKIWAGATVVKG